MLISPHLMDQQGHNFLIVTSSYHSKVKLVGPLEAEKLAESGFLSLFNTGFPMSLFTLFLSRVCPDVNASRFAEMS